MANGRKSDEPKTAAARVWSQCCVFLTQPNEEQNIDGNEAHVPRRALSGRADQGARAFGDAWEAPAVASWPKYAAEAAPWRFRKSLLRTAASAVLPGSGLLGTRARRFGLLVLVPFVGCLLALAVLVIAQTSALVAFALDPVLMRNLAIGLLVLNVAWVAQLLITYEVARPRILSDFQRAIGAVVVFALSLMVSVPLSVASSYAYTTSDLVADIFSGGSSSSSKTGPTANRKNPWAGKERINILLLGGDSGIGRDIKLGIRTDTIMMASVDTKSGDTVLVQIPRNMARIPFPEGSELDEVYPNGFYDGYNPDDPEYFANAMWDNVPRKHPELFTDTDYPGADALKLGIGEAMGVEIDYFALANIDGLQQLIDALGGVTVNINFDLGLGNTEDGCITRGVLKAGPDQHLDGTNALHYARSRCNDPEGDYGRMKRQSCLIKAIVDQASPAVMLTKYEGVANAGKDMVMTDIPQQLLPSLADLAMLVKDAKINRVTFQHGHDGFDTTDPDYDEMAARLRQAIQEQKATPTPTPAATAASPTTASPATSSAPSSARSSARPQSTPTPTQAAEDLSDACAYHPVTK